MDFPLELDIEILQTDFIQVEILELTESYNFEKKSCFKAFVGQILVSLAFIIIFLISKDIQNTAIYFPVFFIIFFIINFLYKYFIGNKQDYNNNIEHLIKSDALGNRFFKDERGMVVFKKDEIQFLTNINRRYFSYDKLRHIKETKRLFVFVLKIEKDASIRGFHYMIIPKRCMDNQKLEKVYNLIENIKNEYNLTDWVNCKIFD